MSGILYNRCYGGFNVSEECEKKYLKSLACGFDHPKVCVHVGDGGISFYCKGVMDS